MTMGGGWGGNLEHIYIYIHIRIYIYTFAKDSMADLLSPAYNASFAAFVFMRQCPLCHERLQSKRHISRTMSNIFKHVLVLQDR